MRVSSLTYKLALGALALSVFTGCKRENGIDNDTVIKKPYSLYIGGIDGALYHTNDGTNYDLTFGPDGYAFRALTTSAHNILFVKRNVHLSEDEGLNFNPTDSSVNPHYLFLDGQLGVPYTPWPSIIKNVPEHGRIYLVSGKGRGIIFSEDNGRTWQIDQNWDQYLTHSGYTSIATVGGKVVAHNYVTDSFYVKDNKDDAWSYVVPGNMLPGATWFLSTYNDALIATDIRGSEGVYHSSNLGKDWQKYNGLPGGTILFCTAAPFNSSLLVGTQGKGVYRLQGGQFVPSNNGMEENATVYSIVGKDQVFKNNVKRQFIYAATDKGVFRSEDNGINWTEVLEGSFVQVY